MSQLTPTPHPDLLVGPTSGDDAAVWRLSEDRAIVATADFITPVVDDARTWGRVAAANAVSDVYAMGGTPLFALNLVCWNVDVLPSSLLGEVLEGGSEIALEAGFVIAGGHTVDDPEPKYGMSVTGEVDPRQMFTNAGLVPGQDLILTKPLGIGIITTAIKADRAPLDVAGAAVLSMTRLNAAASKAAMDAGATGCTDVTGFGLFGHLGRMAKESGVAVDIDVAAVPFFDGARSLAEDGFIPGGTRRNWDWIGPQVETGSLDQTTILMFADAQTSGGLVFGVDPGETAAVQQRLTSSGNHASVIGRTTEGTAGLLTLR